MPVLSARAWLVNRYPKHGERPTIYLAIWFQPVADTRDPYDVRLTIARRWSSSACIAAMRLM